MQIDSRQLTAFAAVLNEGSFEAAARLLHLTPSAVSQRIKALEERLGRVLIRRGAPCVATEAGESLQRHAQQLRLLEAQALAPFGLGDGGAGEGGPSNGAPASAGSAASPRSASSTNAENAENADRARGVGSARLARAAPSLPLAIAVNADSLATWFVPALAALRERHALQFDLHVDDQDHSSLLLRQGRVLAAVSAQAAPVQGCKVVPLGRMRYLAVASPAFMQRYFAHGISEDALAIAPCNVFNQKDQLQARFLRRLSRRHLEPPLHRVPGTHGFIHAAVRGLGWGMNPDVQVAPLLARGELVELLPGRYLDVPLYWQHWSLDAPVLRALTDCVHAAAHCMLHVD